MNRTLLHVRWLRVIALAVNIAAEMEMHGIAAHDLLAHFVELYALNVNVGEVLKDLQLAY